MKKQLSLLMLVVAMLLPWVTQAQNITLANYGFTTGVDSTKWVNMTGATQILTPSNSDGLASSVVNIGFSFPFGAQTYTQYSVNTDGNLRLGSTVTGTSSYTTPFSSTNSNNNNPKINAFGCDGYGVSGSHYVKAKNTTDDNGDTLLAVEFCMGTYTSATRDYLYKWQVHLYANGNIDIVFPSAAGLPSTFPAVAHQCGLCASSSDGWVISAASNTAEHFTAGSSSTNTANTWFDANRYYSFVHPDNISCPAPTGLTVSNITTDGATLSWTAGGSEMEWELAVGDDIYTTTINSYTVTNLEGNTPYVASVRAICGAGDTSFAFSTSFRTACVAISQLPYVNDFENEPAYSTVAYADAFPACWHRINDATGTYNYYPYIYASSSYAHSGGVGMYWYHSTTTSYANNEYAVLPPVDLNIYTMSDLTLAFYAKTTSTSYHPQPIVGVMTDPTNASTFTPLYTFTDTEITTDWQLFAVSLASYTGNGAYIAIKWPRTASTSYLAIDDIFLTDEWCDIPSDVTATAGIDEITLSWGTNGGSSFTVVLGEDTITNVSDSTYTFTALNSNTEYTYSVSTECSGGNSMFIGGSIRTLCTLIDSLPYSYGFEDLATGSTSVRPVIPCWTHLNNGTSYFGYPYVSSTTPHSGTRNLYWYGSTTTGTYGDYQIVVLPGVDTNIYPMNTLQFTFWARPSSTSYSPVFLVGVMTDPNDANTFQQVATINVQNVTTWQEFTTTFDTYTGYGNFVAVRMNRPSSSYYAYTDDFTLRTIPTCFWPTNVTAESVYTDGATINWTPDSRTLASSWYVEYGPHGFTPGTGITETVSDTTISLTGLTANSEYDIYISADCGGDVSDPVSYTFRTLCTALDVLPFTENFDNVTGSTSTSGMPNILPSCWNYYNDGTRTNYQGCPYVYNSSTYSHSGSNSIRFYSYAASGDSNQYLILPPVDSTIYPINTLRVGFWLRAYSTSSTYHADVVVGVMTNPADEASFVPVSTVHSSSTTYAHYEVNLGQYTGAQGCVALKFPVPTASSNYEYGYVDDVTLEVAPTCAPVVSHTVNTTAGSASITWTPDPTFANAPDSYEVSYGYADDSLAGATTVTTSDPEMVLTGLTADTTYMMSIQPLCSDGTAPAHVFNFSTRALPCLEWDTTGNAASGPADTITLGSPGTSTTNVMPVNQSYNYSYCQHIFLASEIPTTGPTSFSGIAFDYAYTQPMTHATNVSIYLANTTRANFAVTAGSSTDSMFVPYSQLQLVYTGPLNCTVNGWNYFQFNQGSFQYDGVSNLCVAIVDNSGSSDGTAFIFRYQSTSGQSSMTHRVFGSTPYGPTEMDAARAGQSYFRSNTRLMTGGGGDCLTLASCAAPDVDLGQNAAGDIEISWIPGYQETSWDVDYRAEDDSIWTNLVSGTSSMSHTVLLSDLQPNTEYQFRVSPNCSDTVISTTVSFTTPCGLFNVPFNESFDTWSTTAADPLPSCWDKHTNYTTNYPYASTSYHHSGSKAMYMYSTNTTYSYMVLPQFNLPIDSTVVSFWLYKTNTSYAHALEVGVMTDPDNVNTFVTVASVAPAALSTWEAFEVPLNSYTGNGRYIAIKSPDGVYSYPYLDDLTVDRLAACPRVTNVEATNISTTTATITWDTTSATDYEVQYGPFGFTLGSGTTVSVSGVDSVDIAGLSANTAYDVYVRGVCTSDTGNWSYTYTFRTECSMIDSLPFVEDFESYGSGTTAFPSCWYKLGSTADRPYINATTSYGHNNSYGLYFYAAAGGYCYGVMPPVDSMLDLTTLQVNFWARQYSTSYNCDFVVGMMTNPADATTFVAIDTVHPEGTTYEEFSVSLANYAGTGNHIAFSAIQHPGTSTAIYMMLDDVTLELLPTCPRVEDFMAIDVMLDTIVVAWSDTSSNSSWNVEYDTVEFAPGTGHMTAIHVTDTFCVIPGLDSATTYHIYVYPDCGTDVFYRHIAVTTLAASPATVPFSCNFEAAGVNGWDLLTAGQTNYWMVGNATGNTGRSLYVTNNGSSNDYSNTAISYSYAVRYFNLTDTGDYAYSFDWKCNGEGNYDFIRALLVPASMNIEAGTPLFGSSAYNFGQTVAPNPWIDLTGKTSTPYGLNVQTTWQNRTGVMHISTPGTYMLVFAWVNDGSGGTTPPGAIDNVSLVLNSCAMPQNVTAAVTGDSISLSWTPGGSESEWEVALGTTTVVVTTPNHTFTGLTPNTNYTVSIRSICGAGDSSLVYTESFHTPCGAVSLPYSNNFDSYTTSTTAATGVQVNCWDYIMTGSSSYQSATYQPQIYYSSSYAHSGNYSLRLYGESYTMMPPMPTSLDSLQLTFWDYTTSTSYGLEVGVMEGNTFVPVETITSPISTHVEYTVYFNNYTGNSRIIAFRNHYTTSTTTYYSYHYIDDVLVEYLPTCPPVTDLSVTYTTEDTITIGWSPVGSETQWLVSNNGTTWSTCNDTTYTFSGLTASTLYTMYVRPLCNVGDTGTARTITSRTTCSAASLPYSENFDALTTGTATSNLTVVPACWDYILTGSSTYQAAAYYPGVYYSSTNAHSGSYSYRLYGEGYHMLPPMPTSLDSLQLTFWDYTTSTSYGLEVGVMEGNTFVPIQTISSPTSTHVEYTVYFGTYTGNSRIIAFHNYYTTSTTSNYSYHYIDNVEVDYLPTCPPVLDVHSVVATPTSITIDWVDQSPATQWQVEHGSLGHTLGSGTIVTVNSHPYTVYGLDTLTNYDFYVRPICSSTDTGNWSARATLSSGMCESMTEFYTGTPTGTNNQGPVNNYYRHTLSETIIDSAELAGIGEISYIAYSYNYASPMTDKINVKIWFQPTNKTEFNSNTDAVAVNPATAVKVYQGSLNCVQGWNYFALDTNYVWDGHSNLLVIVQDNSGEYDGSAYVFDITATSNYKYLIYYRDGTAGTDTISAYNPSTFTASTAYRYQRRPTMKLLSCGGGCPTPVVSTVTHTYGSANITVSGNGNGFELSYGTDPSTLGTTLSSTTGTFSISGLVPATQYFYSVVQLCDSGIVSNAATGFFTTDSLPCMEISNLTVSAITYDGATLSWTAGSSETAWEVIVYNTIDTVYETAYTNSITVNGLASDMQYMADVRPLCGSNHDVEGPWTLAPVSFTTKKCQPVTDVTVVEVTSTTATIAWTAATEGSGSYRVEYGPNGMAQGQGTSVTATTNSYTIEGLEADLSYDVYVANICADNLVSTWSSVTTFQTTTGGGGGDEGIAAVDAEGNLSIYPNPASSMVTLTVAEMLSGAEVTIVDLNGRTVMTFSLQGTTATFDVSQLSQGAYFVRLTGEQATTVRKLIVK